MSHHPVIRKANDLSLTPTDLYRLYDTNGVLLYVGISNRWPSRMKQHTKDKQWFNSVGKVEISHYCTRREAEAAEKAAIKSERPIHNVLHNKKEATKPVQDVYEMMTQLLKDHSLLTIRQYRDIARQSDRRPVALEMHQVAHVLALPQIVCRDLATSGQVPSELVNGRRLVRVDDLENYVEKLIAERCATLITREA